MVLAMEVINEKVSSNYRATASSLYHEPVIPESYTVPQIPSHTLPKHDENWRSLTGGGGQPLEAPSRSMGLEINFERPRHDSNMRRTV
jgi:hypothetical protein